MSKISVIVPVYNAESYFSDCIESILRQTFHDFELILVNDGSTDSSGEMCDQFADRDSRIKVVHQQNQGQASARNNAVNIASSEWVCFVDSDDMIHHQMLEVLYDAVIKGNAKISMCSATNGITPPQNFFHHVNAAFSVHSVNEAYLTTLYECGGNRPWVIWGKLIHKEIIKRYPFTAGRIFEDNAVACRWLYESHIVANINAELYFYRMTPVSTTRGRFTLKQLDYLWALEEIIVFCKEVNYPNLRKRFCSAYIQTAIEYYQIISIEYTDRTSSDTIRSHLQKIVRQNIKYIDLPKDTRNGVYRMIHPNITWVCSSIQRLCRGNQSLRNIYRRIRFETKLNIKHRLSTEDAQSTLRAYHFQDTPSFVQSNRLEKLYDLMIVIPVYNVERYLEECLDSVFSQKTQYRFCVVAVDDGSIDNSGTLLDRYASHDNLTIIHQENRGYSGARNRAMETIKARYVMFVDSDDILPVNAVEALMKPALLHQADLVAGGYTRFEDGRVTETVHYGTQVSEVPSHTISGYTCMKVIRAELLEQFQFPEGFLFEDTVLSRLVFPLCNKAYTVPEIVYLYRSHSDSISSSHHTQPRCVDTYWITKYCLEEAARRGYTLDETQYMQYLQQCWVNYVRTRALPEEIQKSIFALTRQLLKTYFPNQTISQKGRLNLLHRAFRANSFDAYRFVLDRWDII